MQRAAFGVACFAAGIVAAAIFAASAQTQPAGDKWEYALVYRTGNDSVSLDIAGKHQWMVHTQNEHQMATLYQKLGIDHPPADDDVMSAIVATYLGRDGWELTACSGNSEWFRRRMR